MKKNPGNKASLKDDTFKSSKAKKYSSFIALDIYRLLVAGCTDDEVCKVIGVKINRLKKWKDTKEFLQYVYESAEKEKGGRNAETFEEYVYDRLPPELQDIWKDLEDEQIDDDDTDVKAVFSKKNPKRELAQKLLKNKTDKEKQFLFLHALVKSNFSPTQAMTKVGLSKTTVDRWVANDTKFAEMIREIEFHKKNFLEENLMKLVEQGHAHAIIFANRTQNADRGYGDKSTLKIEGSIDINHKVLPIETLNLPTKTLRRMLRAMKTATPLDHHGNPALPEPKRGHSVELDAETEEDAVEIEA